MSFEENERELLLEKYSFETANGCKYTIEPPLINEVLSGEFTEFINDIGIPSSEENSRICFISLLSDENKRQMIGDFINKYVKNQKGEKISFLEFSDNGATIDDIYILIKRIIGVSG